MIVQPFSVWACCLNPRERGMIVELESAYLLVPTFITKAEYELLWAARGYSLSNPIVVAFNTLYGLTYAEIPIPPLDEVPVYLFDVVTWAFIKDAADHGVFDCPQKCKLLTFPL